jgi:integrase
MTRKRGNKEGSIYKRSNGTWRAQITLEGGRIGHTVKTQAEALAWLQGMRMNVDRGLTLKAATMIFDEFLSEWLDSAKSRLTFETWRSYNQLIRDYISPSLGSIRIRELTALRVQRLYNHQVKLGTGKRTIQKIHSVIRASLNSAKKMGLISNNPSIAADPPKPEVREMQILNEAQVKKLLTQVSENGDRNFCLYYLAFVTGMRQGELLALRWPEVDLDNQILHVKFSLKRVPIQGLQPLKPKTRNSIRAIQLGRDACRVLEKQLIQYKEDKTKAGELWNDLEFVFSSKVGLPLEPAVAYRNFQQTLVKADLPKMRFHDIRHTAASLMLHNGIDVLVASKRLGHAKPSITLDFYGHLLPAIQIEAAKIMEKIVKID